jgi:S-adenosyl-L-methionine hydrolase (adenosine-forming)
MLPENAMTIITLTTDFGTGDGFVGVMKGVILTIAPTAHLVDLSHDVAPQDVRQAAYLLARARPYFPAGTVHLAVVDPGVGSARRLLLVVASRACFVGPDNGLFTPALDEPGSQAFVLDQPAFWLPQVSQTFHGRDIFAPVAAHLAAGVTPAALGSLVSDPVRLVLPIPVRLPGGAVRGEVVYVDHFGNLITNIPAAWLEERTWRCEIAGQTLPGISHSYAAAAPGALLALVSSGGTLEIAMRDGNAAGRLPAGVGATVILTEL